MNSGKKISAKDVKIKKPQKMNAKDIKGLRNILNLSQRDLAVLLNVSIKTVQAWEQGINIPGGSSLKLLDILRCIKRKPQLLGIFRLG